MPRPRATVIGTEVTTDEMAKLIAEAKNKKIGEGPQKQYVIDQLIERYPGIEESTIRRGGQLFSVLDYLMEGSGLA